MSDLKNYRESTKLPGTRTIGMSSGTELNAIEENETHGSELRHSLDLVQKATSQQMNLLEKSASLLFGQMEMLSKVKVDEDGEAVLNPSHMNIELTINLAKTINEIMKTKREALKTTADIICMLKE